MCAKPILLLVRLPVLYQDFIMVYQMVLRIFHIKDENVEESLSREEIRALLESGQENGAINENETDMISNVLILMTVWLAIL